MWSIKPEFSVIAIVWQINVNFFVYFVPKISYFYGLIYPEGGIKSKAVQIFNPFGHLFGHTRNSIEQNHYMINSALMICI